MDKAGQDRRGACRGKERQEDKHAHGQMDGETYTQAGTEIVRLIDRRIRRQTKR